MEYTPHKLMFFDDIYIKSNDLTAVTGPTVIAVAHNEMYLLPAWLDHYRKLGAERFIILDDASTDDTLKYLSDQSDVMVVGSKRRYGDTVPILSRVDPSGESIEERRMVHVWRMILPEKFSPDEWIVQVAIDELLILPEGMTFVDVFEELSESPYDAITAVMLDVYPKDITTMREQMNQPHLEISDDWYFDARSHHVPKKGRFELKYPGSRSRLFSKFIKSPRLSVFQRVLKFLRILKCVIRGRPYLTMANETKKYAIVRWRKWAWMTSSHNTSLKVSPDHYLPILHMKFTGDLYRRSEVALRDKSYYKGSQGYMKLMTLLAEMEQREASFLCLWSASIHKKRAYRKGKLILGFPKNGLLKHRPPKADHNTYNRTSHHDY